MMLGPMDIPEPGRDRRGRFIRDNHLGTLLLNRKCFYRLRHTTSMPMASNAIVAGSGITLSVPFV